MVGVGAHTSDGRLLGSLDTWVASSVVVLAREVKGRL